MSESFDSGLTHFDEQGRAHMVDVSEKAVTLRTASAGGTVKLNWETFNLVRDGKMKKGDVLAVAQIAGVMAAKRNSDLIPMCHPIAITGVDIDFLLSEADSSITITATVRCKGETGVEMEALTAVSVAALTVYDMCKAVQKDIIIDNIHLVKKTGGKSGDYLYKGDKQNG
jgi:cyclic pyranopterin phosphate synthase